MLGKRDRDTTKSTQSFEVITRKNRMTNKTKQTKNNNSFALWQAFSFSFQA